MRQNISTRLGPSPDRHVKRQKMKKNVNFEKGKRKSMEKRLASLSCEYGSLLYSNHAIFYHFSGP